MLLRLLVLFVYFIKITYQGSTSFVNTESYHALLRSKRQSESPCVLPDHPANGEFKIFGHEQDPYLPNSDAIANTIIDLSCTNGAVTETGGPFRAICYQGKWKPPLSQTECVRTCPQMQKEEESLSTTCTHRNPRINCSNPIDGTVVEIVCKPFYENLGSRPFNITCRNGSWDTGRWDSTLTPCQPKCGRARVSVQPLIFSGATAIKSIHISVPWVAGIYRSNDTQLIGAGTFISKDVVLSAAHLFTNDEGDPLDENNFIVTVGKSYRNFDEKRDIYMQSSHISRLYIPETYQGAFQNHVGDLAILTLKDKFTFTEYVQPACIDWKNQYESSVLREDNKGEIAGWGYTKSSSKTADKLQKLEVLYKSRNTCSLAREFKKRYYTYDKFCADYNDNNADICAGDDGGGLVFESPDSRFFLVGILSVAPSENGRCDNASALYTKISKYLPEIENEIKGMRINSV